MSKLWDAIEAGNPTEVERILEISTADKKGGGGAGGDDGVAGAKMATGRQESVVP